MNYINITDSNRELILELFDKTTDGAGYIVESATEKKIICPYSKKSIHIKDFSILPGTATFVNNFPFCFAEHRTMH